MFAPTGANALSNERNADGGAVVEFDLDLQPGHQPLCGVTKFRFRQCDLLVVFRIHEVMVRAVGIKIFHFVLLERDLFERVVRTEPELE